jgi:hypothetical protein
MDFVNWLKSQRDRVVAWLLIAIGGLCILGGWIGVTNTIQVYNQLTYLVSGAIVGLFFLGVGVALLLSADFHDEWRKLDRIEAALRGRPLPDVGRVLDLGDKETAAAEPVTQPPGGAVPSESVMTASALPDGAAALPVRRELAWAMPGLVVSVALIAFAWMKSTNSTNAQVGADAVLIAVYGILACGIGVALHSRWLRQSLAQRKGALLGPLVPMAETEAETADVDLAATDSTFYVSEGGKRYHRAGCAIVTSQRAVPATPAQVAQLVACELCN